MGAGLGWDPYWTTIHQTLGSAWASSTQSSPSCIDARVFLDATYIQLSVVYLGTGPFYANTEADGSGYNNTTQYDNGFCGGWICYSALLKLPIHLGRILIFPMAGAEYDQNISYTDAGGNDVRQSMTSQSLSGLNEIWFDFGAGIDISMSSSAYLRFSVLGEFKFLNQDDLNYMSAISVQNGDSVSMVYFRLSPAISFGSKL